MGTERVLKGIGVCMGSSGESHLLAWAQEEI